MTLMQIITGLLLWLALSFPAAMVIGWWLGSRDES